MARAIEVDHVGKRFAIGEDFGRYLTLRESISARFRRGDGDGRREMWALKDVAFSVDEGEVLGIVGNNGAGKTTLLRVLSRITEPTTGRTRTRGRVGALLDVGTGFHPELTGRENVILNGTILGMSTRRIRRHFDEIVDFAGVERFLDTPLKRYSSGMQLRLAFAVAAHLDPEIIVVDEVLAVGDVAFQQKCLAKMGEVAGAGRTVLFVSHTMAAIESLCERVLWLEQGELRADGTPRKVISQYMESAAFLRTTRTWDDPSHAPGNEWIRLRSARAFPEQGSPRDRITVRTPFVLEFEFENLRPGTHLNLSLHLYSAGGVLVLNAVPVSEPDWFGRAYPVGRFRDRCHIPADLLNNGGYRVELMVVRDQGHVVFQDSAILELSVEDVVETTGFFEGEWSGVVRPPLRWETEHLD